MIIYLFFKEVWVKLMKWKIRDFFIVLIWYIFLFKEIRREFDVIFLFNKFLVNLYSFLILLLGYF